MRVLVTGGAGFIGSHIVERFVDDGQQVCVVDNFSSGRRQNLAGCAARIELVEGDVRDAELLVRLTTGCDLVFHQAAVVSVPYSVEHPQETHDVNIQGTLNVLQAARAAGVRRVIYASSAAVYGNDPRLPKDEEMQPVPISPYGLEKLTGEHYCRLFKRLYGVETVSLRYFNVFGPRQDPSSPYSGVISVFVDKLLAGENPTVFGDGNQSRDFVCVDNVVQANLLAATAPRAAGGCFNVGLGRRTSINQLLALVAHAAGREASPRYMPARAGDIRDSVADITRARRDLDYRPTISVEIGVRRLVAFERECRVSSASR